MTTRDQESRNRERRWDDLFSRSQDLLAQMADEAHEEYRAGLTEPLVRTCSLVMRWLSRRSAGVSPAGPAASSLPNRQTL